jgi:hypothetical protein
MQEKIEKALKELARFNLPWQGMVRDQLEYCREVDLKNKSSDRLEDLNMGLVAVREIDEKEPLYSLLTEIQYEMQRKYLSYAAKVRLNIHSR